MKHFPIFCQSVLGLLSCIFLPQPLTAQNRLYINEVQVANVDVYVDPSFNYGGWIELYNADDEAVSLAGMKLRHTSADGEEEEYLLQRGDISSKGFYNLWFDHNSADGYYGGDSRYQVPFKLDYEGGRLEIFDKNGVSLDVVYYPAAIARCSYCRKTDGGADWGLTSCPTPSKTNAGTVFAEKRMESPVVSHDGGVITGNVNFQVSIPKGATLHYTTDGSTPIPGKSPVSSTGIFQVNATTIYRFLLTCPGLLNSPVVTRTFLQRVRPYYLPIISVSTNPDNLFDDVLGLYVCGTNGRRGNNKYTPCNQNMDWDRPVNVEYFVPDTKTGTYHPVLNQEVSFSLFGGWTRFNDGDDFFEYKPSFKLKAEKQYEGLNFFPHPVFDAKPHLKLKHLLVRNGGQDQHGRIWDAAIQEIIRTSGIHIDCQAYQPAHIFLDGHELGMFNLREPSNKQFAFSNYGIDKDEIDQWEDEVIMREGNRVAFDKWYNLSVKLAGNPTAANWAPIADILDVDEYCNYMAAEIYMGNLDWFRGGFKNIKGFRQRSDNGKFHYVLYDTDGGFGDTDMIRQIYDGSTSAQPKLFLNMMRYEPFRKQFVDAYCLMGGSVFESKRSVAIIREMAANTETALSWEGYSALTKAQTLIDRLNDRTNQHDKRMESLTQTLKLKNPYKLKISSNAQARLLVNGQEIPTGAFDGTLFPPISLTATDVPGKVFKGWQLDGEMITTDSIYPLHSQNQSGSYQVKAIYSSSPLSAAIRINEVCAGNDIYINEYFKKSDWLELYNCTDKDLNLAGMYLSDNPENPRKHLIPEHHAAMIPAHGFRIVWCDGRESDSELHAPFKLSNTTGSSVSIMAADESWVDCLVYLEQGRWQSFGRYPDGGDNVALFDRITIDASNHINTQTRVDSPQATSVESIVPHRDSTSSKKVVSVEYYNMNGQRINSPSAVHIFIQRVTYDDGSWDIMKKFSQ